MADKNNIPEASYGDKHIDTEDFNRIVGVVNKLEKAGMSGDGTTYYTEDGITRSTLTSGFNIGDFPFRIEDYTGTDISIIKGRWVRDQVETIPEAGGACNATQDEDDENRLVIDINNFLNNGVANPLVADVPYYVYLKLGQNVDATTVNFDEALIPGKVEILVDNDREAAAQRTPEEAWELMNSGGSNLRDFWVKDKQVIGTVTLYEDADPGGGANVFRIDSISQYIDEDVNDNATVLDTEYLSSDAYARDTIVRNQNATLTDPPDALTSHFGEVQIKNVDLCPGNSSFSYPYFLGTLAYNSIDERGSGGRVYWSSFDTRYNPGNGDQPNINTIRIQQDTSCLNPASGSNNYTMTSLYNVENTHIYSSSMCYYDSSDETSTLKWTQGTLQWAALDTHLNTNGYQKSIQIANGEGGAEIVQIYGFSTGSPGASSMDNDFKLLVRDPEGGGPPASGVGANGPGVAYATADDIGNWLRGYDSGWGSGVYYEVGYWWDYNAYHYDLIDINGGGHTANDHGAYWNNTAATLGEYGGADTTYLTNNGTSIGDTTPNEVINLVNRTLVTTQGDWSTTATNKFKVLNTTTTVDGGTAGALEVTGGAYIGDGLSVTGLIKASTYVSAGTYLNANSYCQTGTYIEAGTHFNSIGSEYRSNGTKVVGAQGATVTDPNTVSGTATVGPGNYGFASSAEFNTAITDINTIRTKVEDIIDRLQAHGLIA